MRLPARHIAKQGLFGAARLLGVGRLLQHRTRDHLLVLCYHGVVSDDQRGDELRHGTTVSRGEFREHLRILDESFHCVDVAAVRAWLAGSRDLPPSPVLISFDDGFRNVWSHAAPELARRSLPAVVFLATGYVGTRRLLWPQELVERVLQWRGPRLPSPPGSAANGATGPAGVIDLPADARGRRQLAAQLRDACKRLPEEERAGYLEALRGAQGELAGLDRELYDFLDWDEVRDLHRQGIAIGSHSVEHPILSRVSPETLARELHDSKAKIEAEIGAPCEAFAYPNGRPEDLDERVVAALREAGYALGFTLNRSLNPPHSDPLLLDRMDVPGHVPGEVFRARISGLFSLLDRLRPH